MVGTPFGDFRLLRPIGQGGMAEVFLAQRSGPQGFRKQLVIKRLRPKWTTSETHVALFRKEARYAALIDHPNIAHVSDFGCVDDRYYIAMEYVDGLTLQEFLDVSGPLRSGVAARIMIDVLDALEAIHTTRDLGGRLLGLVHRDLTPRNVMVTRKGSVKLLDFGIAIAADEINPADAGTRKYMAPEQVRGEVVGRRADVY
ncbi:MAG: serine/threonine-protein kinase, partial [Myxococcota bacterium]